MSATLKVTRTISYKIIGRPFELRRGSFEVSIDGKVVSFHCHGAALWPRYVASIVKPDIATSLKPA